MDFYSFCKGVRALAKRSETHRVGRPIQAAQRAALRRVLGRVGGAELRALRAMTGVTQAELGRALGLGRNVLPRWETGQRKPPRYIQTIVRLLAINPAALVILSDLAQGPSPGSWTAVNPAGSMSVSSTSRSPC
jgi:DNA-binding transcriptional regulator YiaG